MKLTAKIERATESARWDAFAAEAANSSVFASSVWSDAVMKLTGQSIARVVVEASDGRLLAGLITLDKHKAGVRVALKPWATAYCGVLYARDLSHSGRARVSAVLAEYLSACFACVRIETPPAFADALPFERAGFRLGIKHTYLLSPQERPLLEHVEPALRRQIKKAHREGLRVSRSEDSNPLCDMYRELYAEQGVDIAFGRLEFSEFCQRLRERNVAALFYASEGEGHPPVAGMLVGRQAAVHYYLLAAFPRRLRAKAGPSGLLHDYVEHVMARAETFDLLGANAYTPGITAFKGHFNPELRTHLVLEYQSAAYRLLVAPARELRARVQRMIAQSGKRVDGLQV
jgi:hypothetical protein